MNVQVNVFLKNLIIFGDHTRDMLPWAQHEICVGYVMWQLYWEVTRDILKRKCSTEIIFAKTPPETSTSNSLESSDTPLQSFHGQWEMNRHRTSRPTEVYHSSLSLVLHQQKIFFYYIEKKTQYVYLFTTSSVLFE